MRKLSGIMAGAVMTTLAACSSDEPSQQEEAAPVEAPVVQEEPQGPTEAELKAAAEEQARLAAEEAARQAALEAAQQAQLRKDACIDGEYSVSYALDAFEVSQDQNDVITAVAGCLNEFNDLAAIIVGSADQTKRISDWDSNIFAKLRAEGVEAALLDAGVSADQIFDVSHTGEKANKRAATITLSTLEM